MYRLITEGSVEELVYARQIYKQQMANIGQQGTRERRYFSGVEVRVYLLGATTLAREKGHWS